MVQYLQVSQLVSEPRHVWYLLAPSRANEHFVKLNRKHKAFHKGVNSSCRLHIRQHYDLYKEKCEKAELPINHWAIPREIWKVMEENKELEKQGQLTKKKQQQMLDFKGVTGPHEFTRAGILHAVAKLIATDNQVSFQYTSPASQH